MARAFSGITGNDSILNSSTGTLATAGTPGTLWSTSAWAYPLSTSTGTHQVSIFGSGGYSFQLRRDTADWNLYFRSSGLDINATFTGGVTANQWFHLAGTYDGSNIRFYVNGVLKQTVAATVSSSSVTALEVGADGLFGGTGSPWDGSIADVALWTTIVLTQAEMTALSLGARPNNIRPKSLVIWWPLTGLQSPEPDLNTANVGPNNGTVTLTTPAFGPPIMAFTPRWPQFLPSAPSGPLTIPAAMGFTACEY